jgi:hypothetical protein
MSDKCITCYKVRMIGLLHQIIQSPTLYLSRHGFPSVLPLRRLRIRKHLSIPSSRSRPVPPERPLRIPRPEYVTNSAPSRNIIPRPSSRIPNELYLHPSRWSSPSRTRRLYNYDNLPRHQEIHQHMRCKPYKPLI